MSVRGNPVHVKRLYTVSSRQCIRLNDGTSSSDRFICPDRGSIALRSEVPQESRGCCPGCTAADQTAKGKSVTPAGMTTVY